MAKAVYSLTVIKNIDFAPKSLFFQQKYHVCNGKGTQGWGWETLHVLATLKANFAQEEIYH